jgi:hypothetical protein
MAVLARIAALVKNAGELKDDGLADRDHRHVGALLGLQLHPPGS